MVEVIEVPFNSTEMPTLPAPTSVPHGTGLGSIPMFGPEWHQITVYITVVICLIIVVVALWFFWKIGLFGSSDDDDD